MQKQSAYGRILLVGISMLAMTVIAVLWGQEKAESMGIVSVSYTHLAITAVHAGTGYDLITHTGKTGKAFNISTHLNTQS